MLAKTGFLGKAPVGKAPVERSCFIPVFCGNFQLRRPCNAPTSRLLSLKLCRTTCPCLLFRVTGRSRVAVSDGAAVSADVRRCGRSRRPPGPAAAPAHAGGQPAGRGGRCRAAAPAQHQVWSPICIPPSLEVLFAPRMSVAQVLVTTTCARCCSLLEQCSSDPYDSGSCCFTSSQTLAPNLTCQRKLARCHQLRAGKCLHTQG